MNLIMFGPPGSGKGTQGKRLANEYGLKHISFGDVLRDHIKNKTVIGEKVKQTLEDGKLVGVDIMSLILEDQLNSMNLHKGSVFDGFPRNLMQAQLLNDIMLKRGMDLNGIIFLDVPFEVSHQRIAERAKIEGRLDDQSLEKIATRLQVYHDETLPVYDFYSGKVEFHHINGLQKLEEVYSSIKSSLGIAK